MSFYNNEKQGKTETESYTHIINSDGKDPGYSVTHKITHSRLGYYPEITYTVAGDEVSHPQTLHFKGGLPSLDKAYQVIQQTLRLNKQQFEDLIKNNGQ